MADERTTPFPQPNERIRKGIQAMQSAPNLSIRCVLFSLYSEGDDSVKSRIESLIHEYNETIEFLNAGCESPSCEVHGTGAEELAEDSMDEHEPGTILKGKAAKGSKDETTDHKPWCYLCDDEFDPNDTGNVCVRHPGMFSFHPSSPE